MCELPRAAIVSNRCWSVMINNISGRVGELFILGMPAGDWFYEFPDIIPADRNNAACRKPCSLGIRIAGSRETRLAMRRNHPDEQRTTEFQSRAHCAVSLEHLSPAADSATFVAALGKESLGRPYSFPSTLQA